MQQYAAEMHKSGGVDPASVKIVIPGKGPPLPKPAAQESMSMNASTPSKASLAAHQQRMWEFSKQLQRGHELHEEAKQAAQSDPNRITIGCKAPRSFASYQDGVPNAGEAGLVHEADNESLNLAALASELTTPMDTPMQIGDDRFSLGHAPQYPKGKAAKRKQEQLASIVERAD